MSNVINQTLGEIILDAIKEKGLNQSKIAEKMNVRRQTINQIDRRKTFDLEFLLNLKEATGLDFTSHLYPQPGPKQDNVEIENQHDSGSLVGKLEMALSIKLQSNPEQMNRMGELLMVIRREALKMGFTVL